MTTFLLLLFASFAVLPSNGMLADGFDLLSCSQISQIQSRVRQYIIEKDILPEVVRFAFHSCVGSCNGCLNLRQPESGGLQEVFDDLNALYVELRLEASGVSRADFWAMASQIAVDIGADNHHGIPLRKPCYKYYWGRKDCPTSPNMDKFQEFPTPHFGSNKLFDYFKQMFNFDAGEVVTIMGAHNLGRADIQNTGFDGFWAPGEDKVLNTTYYNNMVDGNMRYNNVDAVANAGLRGAPHWQFNAPSQAGTHSMMFNTDFHLFYEVDLDANGRALCRVENGCMFRGTCGINGNCRASKTSALAMDYVTNPQKFYDHFERVYTKMLLNGQPNVESKGSTCGVCLDKNRAQVQPQQPSQGQTPYQQQYQAPSQQYSKGQAPYQQQYQAPSQQYNKGQAPYQQQYQAPSPQQYKVPAPQQYQAPSPQQYKVPAPQQYQAPSPQQYQAPSPQQYQAPAPQQYQAPAPQQYQAPSPQQYQAPSPQQYQAPSPQQQYYSSQVKPQPQQYNPAQPQPMEQYHEEKKPDEYTLDPYNLPKLIPNQYF